MKNVWKTVNVRNTIKHSARIIVFHKVERNVRDIVSNNVITNVRSVLIDMIKISIINGFRIEYNLRYSKTQLESAYNILETI